MSPFEQIVDLLDREKARYRVVEHPAEGRSEEVASVRGTTVSQWVRERRLEHIRRDLIDPRRSSEGIAAIAASWGFADASHFSKAFRAHVGVSPSSYREHHVRTRPLPP